jgi:hypothetical protein
MLEELLVGLTLAFVGYFLYNVYKTVSDTNSVSQQTSVSPAAPAAETAPAAAAEPEAAPVAESAPVAEEPAAESEEPDAEAEPTEEKLIVLRNPANGETTPVPSNYRFAKKWVKEALVSEGLLAKVYKNSELQGSVAKQVKDALEKFKNMEKYQA